MSAWRPTSNYLYGTPALPARRPVTTSRTELIHISIAFVVLSVDFTILISSWGQDLYTGVLRTSFSLYEILFGVLAGFSGFLAHELAHKVSAERSGYWAEFRMSPFGLLLSLITSVLGFLWAAPGATVIGGMQDIRAWGRTSLAGPAMNLGEGAILVAAAGGVDLLGYGTLGSLLALVALINAYFAAFNLLPFGPLDGRKVWTWSKGVWAASFAIAVAFGIVMAIALFTSIRLV
jgi:Zn-dependent protease